MTVSQELAAGYGRRFNYPELTRTFQFPPFLPEQANVATLSQHLRRSHQHALPLIKDPLGRDFYAEICGSEGDRVM